MGTTTTGDSAFVAAMVREADRFAAAFDRLDPRSAAQEARARTLDDLEDLARMVVAVARRQDSIIRAIVALEMYDERLPLRGRERVGIISGLEAMVSARDPDEHRRSPAAGGTTP